MNVPHRVQLSRTAGWRMPENTVKVDRSTSWGNPFIPGTPPADLTLEQCLAAFEVYAGNLDLTALRGKNLACWCAPDAPCHADILLRLANPVPPLRIITDDGTTFFEGEDYTTKDWAPGRQIVFGGRSHRIIRNWAEVSNGSRTILVSSIAQRIRKREEVTT